MALQFTNTFIDEKNYPSKIAVDPGVDPPDITDNSLYVSYTTTIFLNKSPATAGDYPYENRMDENNFTQMPMIKQKLTRAMIVSCMKMSGRGILEIDALRRDLPGHDSIARMQLVVEGSNLQRFYDLMESKLLKAKYLREDQTLTISIDPNFAFAFLKYGIIDHPDGYDLLVAERVKEPISKYLLK